MIEFVPTPCDVFNRLTGGGLRFSTLTELSGEPGSGKSTFAYQTAAEFLEAYPIGYVAILDVETSTDDVRMEYVFGLKHDCIDDPFSKPIKSGCYRVFPAPTIEDGFSVLLQVINWYDKRPALFIWDTISAAPCKQDLEALRKAKSSVEDDESETDEVGDKKKKKKSDKPDITMYSGGISLRQRMTKHFLQLTMSEIYGKRILFLLPNQVFTKLSKNKYLPSKVDSGGGYGLKHNCHYHLKFKTDKNYYDDDKNPTYVLRSLKRVSAIKSKFCPEFLNMPLYISTESGGKIDINYSVFLYALEHSFVSSGGGWYRIVADEKRKGMKLENFIVDKVIQDRLRQVIEDNLRSRFILTDMLFKLKEKEKTEKCVDKISESKEGNSNE
jgi:RecA/RadA recombinase